MKALLYSDWCAMRSNMRQYVLIFLVMGFLVCLGGIEGNDAAAATDYITQSVVTYVGFMVTTMSFFSLFGTDERVGWESVRLSLPFTRNQIVRSRYLLLVLLVLGVSCASALVGIVAGEAYAMARFGRMGLAPSPETLFTMAATLAIILAYAAIEMPFFFWKGISKARFSFFIPMLCVPLFSNRTVQGTLEQFGSAMLQAMGPAGLTCGLAVLVVALYLASLVLSQRLYAARDF